MGKLSFQPVLVAAWRPPGDRLVTARTREKASIKLWGQIATIGKTHKKCRYSPTKTREKREKSRKEDGKIWRRAKKRLSLRDI